MSGTWYWFSIEAIAYWQRIDNHFCYLAAYLLCETKICNIVQLRRIQVTLNWLNEPFEIKIIKTRQHLDAFIVFYILIALWTAKNRFPPLRPKILNQLWKNCIICCIIDLSCRIISLENAAEFPFLLPHPIRSPVKWLLYHENKKRADSDIIVTINTLLEPIPIICIVHFINNCLILCLLLLCSLFCSEHNTFIYNSKWCK